MVTMRFHCSPTITISRSLNVAKWKEPQDSASAGADGYALKREQMAQRKGRCLVGQVVGFSWFGLHLRFGMSLVPDCVCKTGSALNVPDLESYFLLTTNVRRL